SYEKAEGDYVPRLNGPGQHQRGKDESLDHGKPLGPEQQMLAVVSVRHNTGERAEKKRGDLVGKGHHAEQKRRAGNPVDKPAKRDLLCPCPDKRHTLAEEKKAVIPVSECSKNRPDAYPQTKLHYTFPWTLNPMIYRLGRSRFLAGLRLYSENCFSSTSAHMSTARHSFSSSFSACFPYRSCPCDLFFRWCPSGNTGAISTPREVSVRKGGIFRPRIRSVAGSGKERACPPSRQAQDKFACRREGLRGGVHQYRLAGRVPPPQGGKGPFPDGNYLKLRELICCSTPAFSFR